MARTENGKVALKLSNAWKQYSISLAGKNLSDIKTAFAYVVTPAGQPITFYLDDIRYH